MKVSPTSVPLNNPDSFISALEATSPMHNSTLKFIDDSLEESYQKYIRERSQVDGSPLPSIRTRYCFFGLMHFGGIALLLLLNGIDYLVGETEERLLALQEAILAAVGLLSIGMTALAYNLVEQRKCVSAAFILLYFVSVTGVALSDKSVLSVYTDSSPSHEHFPVMLTILLLTGALEAIACYDFVAFCLCGLSGALIFLVVVLTGGQGSHLTIFEFLCMLVYTVGGTRRVFQNERVSRRLFFVETAEKEQRLIQHSSPGGKSAQLAQTPTKENYQSEVENISNLIQSSISIIGEASKLVIYEDLRGRLKQALQNLSLAGNKLKTGPNIYDAKVENMNPDIDEEDRQFVRENFTNQVDDVTTEYRGEHVTERKLVDMRLTCEFADVMTVLSQMGRSWNFDTFFLQELTSGRALSISARYSLISFGLVEKFAIPEQTIISYFEHLEANYKPNPYHNSCHAADVLNSTLYLSKSSVLLSYLTEIEILALIVATLGHDVGHQALTNRYLVATRDQLAITYNDASVLENMHASFTFAIMHEETKNIFKSLDSEKWILARKVVIKMILATDMSRHFELLGQFSAGHASAQTTNLSRLEERITVLEIAIKCGDIGHAAKSLELHEKWTLLVCEEFFRQGDLEKALGQPVSMYCDRDTTDIAKSQSGFIAVIVLPLFATLNSFLESTAIETHCLAQLRANKEHWDAKNTKKRRYTVKSKVSAEDRENEFQNLKEKLRSWKRG